MVKQTLNFTETAFVCVCAAILGEVMHVHEN